MEINLNKFKERVLTIDSIGLMYILVVGGLCHILPIPEIVKGFLALPSLLIFYYLFGKSMLHLTSKTLNNYGFLLKLKGLDAISQLIFFWLFGFFMITILIYLLNVTSSLLIFKLGIFFIQDYVLKYVFLYSFLFILFYELLYLESGAHNLSENRKIKIHNANNLAIDSKTILFFILFSISIVTTSHIFMPFPYIGELYISVSLDEHTSTQLLYDGYIILSNPRLANVEFNSIGHVFFDLDILTLNWVAPYLFFFLYVVGSYLLFYSISKNRFVSLSGSLVGSLFVTSIVDWSGVMLYKGNMFFVVLLPFVLFFIHNSSFIKDSIPKKEFHILVIVGIIFTIIVLVLNLFFLLKSGDISLYILKYFVTSIWLLGLAAFGIFYKKELLFTFLIISFGTLFFHAQEFTLFGAVVILYWLGILIIKLKLHNYLYLLIFFIFLCFLFFIAQYFNILDFTEGRLFNIITNFYGYTGYQFNFDNNFNIIKNHTNITIWLFAIISSGFILAYTLVNEQKQKNIVEVFMVFMFAFLTCIYFLPEGSFTRIEKFIPLFVGYIIGVFIFYTYKILNEKHISLFGVSILILIIFITSVSTLYQNIQPPAGYSYYPKFADYEYDACGWMKNNLQENIILITDRFSYFTMVPLSQNIYFLSLDMNPNMDETKEYDRNKWMLIKEIFHNKNSTYVYNNIKKLERMPIEYIGGKHYVAMKTIKDPKFKDFSSVVVISGRTIKAFDKAEKTKNQNTLPIEPYYSLDRINHESRYLKTFNDEKYFTLLYNNSDYIYIYGVNPEPGVPFKIQNNSK